MTIASKAQQKHRPQKKHRKNTGHSEPTSHRRNTAETQGKHRAEGQNKLRRLEFSLFHRPRFHGRGVAAAGGIVGGLGFGCVSSVLSSVAGVVFCGLCCLLWLVLSFVAWLALHAVALGGEIGTHPLAQVPLQLDTAGADGSSAPARLLQL